MGARQYGQFCGLARALELVGERWALLVVRDLILGPKRFTDLRRALPRIPSNILAARLKELEAGGVVCRRALPRPGGGVVYELTDYGRELRDIVLRLGAWGARSLGEPGPDDIVTAESMRLALEATFQADAARGLSAGFELRMGPHVVLHARVRDGVLETGDGPLPEADLRIETGPGLRALLSGEITPDEALASGRMRIHGDRAWLGRFAQVFRLGPAP